MTDKAQGTEPAGQLAATTDLRVPKEPTAEMIAAAWKYGDYAKSDAPDPVYTYKAMVAVGATQVEQNTAPAPVSVLVRVGTSLANLARRFVEEHGQDNRLTQRLDLARRNWETIACTSNAKSGFNEEDHELTVLEGKLSGLEELLTERDAENSRLLAQLQRQKVLLNDSFSILESSEFTESQELAARIKPQLTPVEPVVTPVEWFDVVDLPAYEAGTQYVILTGDVNHLCTEKEKQNPKEKRWFYSSLDGSMIPVDVIEAWRPHKDYLPPAGWVNCSPEWLQQGGKCGEAPRWYDGKIGNHYHPPVDQSSTVLKPNVGKHYPVEFGPRDARQMHCACGNTDPAHAGRETN